ncbi:uncharacterized protein LOC128995463 [Macrosteles quadrilineatus]|uniref:uncharacterized protein LOC128995463 n=1 Tax=Macrosteles quadrilineatus TaxID=74068 RepID=UPI0023E1B2C8|nr:uncharacterized protein LOC128995463 [Macrosteles quadrilineatus]
MLANRKQKKEENIAKYLQELKLLSKDCNFRAIDGNTYRDEAVRDAFISGIMNPHIRQRLLEKSSLTLKEAEDISRSLESAQKSCEAYGSSNQIEVTYCNTSSTLPDQLDENIDPEESPTSAAVAKNFKQKCFYCGGRRHFTRNDCPAKDATCSGCKKRGHFVKVCRLVKTQVNLDFGGDKLPLSICNVACASVEPPCLFHNLSPDCKPIATKSRRYSNDDEKFINSEVQKLLQSVGMGTSKIKNEKITRWRLELSPYSFDIQYRPGKENVTADAFSRVCGAVTNINCDDKLFALHQSLCHPGITRMYHWVKSKNLPYSVEDVKTMTNKCPMCAEIKPRFYKTTNAHLIKATKPFERLNVDFKGPLPSCTRNRYLLTIIDEYSRFPFAYPCSDMSSSTVVRCLENLFSIFGMPNYIHSDRGTSFLSKELRDYLHERGIATSQTTPYNPAGNGQVEKFNGTLWKAILLALKSRSLKVEQWEVVLNDALHSIRSLLCTSTNSTPHERFFIHPRRSLNGTSLPAWLMKPGPIFLKRNVRPSKFDPLVEEVELMDANPHYALVKHNDGRKSTVSLKHLSPRGDVSLLEDQVLPTLKENPQLVTDESQPHVIPEPSINPDPNVNPEQNVTPFDIQDHEYQPNDDYQPNFIPEQDSEENQPLERPKRSRKPPSYLADYIV